MDNDRRIVIAAKCIPQEKIILDIQRAGLEAIELYLTDDIQTELRKIIKLCKVFSFRYAVHAPSGVYEPGLLAELSEGIKAEVVIFHNIYWEDEWDAIYNTFKDTKVKLCIENTYSIHEPLKFMRRYGLHRCLDLEHLQLECGGFYEEGFTPVIKQASHIHLTGYVYGSQLSHTHIHYSPEHNLYILNLLDKAGYSGLVVSEAKTQLQTYEEFARLNDFYQKWRKSIAVQISK